MARPNISLKGLSKNTAVNADTRFVIDYSWWEESGRSIESYLSTRLGREIELDDSTVPIDLIDMETGEVRQLNSFEYSMQSIFTQLPDDYTQRASLVDSVFLVLLANGNRPMSATEIGAEIDRAPDTIYKTLGGNRIHQGIRVHLA